MIKKTILHPDITAVNFITGFRGLGKTLLITQYDLPQNIALFDFETKGSTFDNQLDLGYYNAPTVECGDTGGLELYNYFMSKVAALESNTYTVVGIDNIAPLEMAFNAEAVRDRVHYAKKYGLNANKIATNAWGHQKAVVNCMIADLCTLLWEKGVQVVVVTSHVRAAWAGGQQVPGKYRYKGADKWQELSTLTLILQRGKHAPIPEALVQKEQLAIVAINRDPSPKQLEQMRRGEAGHIITRRLPFKLPRCQMQDIRHYLYNPVDIANLAPDEIPTDAERAAFSDKLSKEQLGFIMHTVDMAKAEEQAEQDAIDQLEQNELHLKVRTLLAKGKSPGAIAKKLGLKVKDIRPIITAIRGESK